MSIYSRTHKEKIDAAYILLTEETTSFEKFEKVRLLIKGLNPKIDHTLSACSNAVKQLKKIQKGEIIDLAVEALPAKSEKDKKRRKILLLFLTSWKSLKSEVGRIQKIYQEQKGSNQSSLHGNMSAIGRIFYFAKGPLGIITALALVVVGAGAVLNNSLTTITIRNRGCAPINPVVKLPVPIPFIKLPTNIIPDGGSASVTLPPLSFSVEDTQRGRIILGALNFTMEFNLPGKNTDLIFNNQSLLGKRTTIDLSSAKQHEVVIKCQ